MFSLTNGSYQAISEKNYWSSYKQKPRRDHVTFIMRKTITKPSYTEAMGDELKCPKIKQNCLYTYQNSE